jgi:hypothetical protein
MKVWSTKYALSPNEGIKEVEVEECFQSAPEMVRVLNSGYGYYLHGQGREWHLTEMSALEKGIVMADKKMASLKKQIEKIRIQQAKWKNREDIIKGK